MGKIFIIIFILFCSLVLALSIRGNAGNPNRHEINYPYWKENGPLELSPERGRFALMYSIVEDHSFVFDLPVARFTTPDLAIKDGKYVSLFAPGVSFLAIPGYIFGKMFGSGQVGAYSVVALFALINALLIRSISINLGVNKIVASVSAMMFVFATPAFAYAVNLYQHHISTFLILLSIYSLVRWKSAWSLCLVWFLAAFSLSVDYPNLFLMFPIAIYGLGRLVYLKKEDMKYTFGIRVLGFLTFLTLIPPFVFFVWFNSQSYGNPFQLSSTLKQVRAIDGRGLPTEPDFIDEKSLIDSKKDSSEKKDKTAVGFFKTRYLLNGLYIHFISPDRGVFWFAPVILIGVFGMIFLYQKHANLAALLLSLTGVNVVLYSMWGDPWGGWAFGSRYLIPTYAVVSICIAFLLDRYRKKTLFILLFFFLMSYSVGVNTLGALTSSRNPPQIEILELEKNTGVPQKYTFERNIDFILENNSKSYIWRSYLKGYINATYYYWIIASSIIIFVGVLLIYMRIVSEDLGMRTNGLRIEKASLWFRKRKVNNI